MRMRLPVAALCALLGATLALGACVTNAPPPVVVGANPYPPPPPPQPEARPLPPVSEAQQVWRMGEWEWTGTGYAWRPGQWEALGGHSTQYLLGHWTQQDGQWLWEPGHWL